MNIKIITLIIIILLIIFVGYFYLQNNKNKGENTMNENNSVQKTVEETSINININGTSYSATLENNETAREFIKKLPLTITMNELNGNEKYYYFDESLPEKSSKVEQIEAGDIMLYGDNCLVIFYKSFNTSYTYTKIGKIDNPQSLAENVGNESIEISFNK